MPESPTEIIDLNGSGGGGLETGDIDTSAELAAIITDETGTGGVLVFNSSPTLAGTVIYSSLTATTVPVLNGSKGLISSAVTPTELGYLTGVTSAIQTQLGLKAALAGPTFTGTLAAADVTISGSTTLSALTATTVPVLNGSKVLISSAVTPTELGYLTGVTSAIQTQITANVNAIALKLDIANPSATGTLTIDSDVKLVRDAANTLALRNGTSAQAFRLYNTYGGGGTDYERLAAKVESNSFIIETEFGGTGVSRSLRIGTGSAGVGTLFFRTAGTSRWEVNGSGHLLAVADNTYDIGASGATRPRAIYVAGTGTFGGLVTAVNVTSSGWLAAASASPVGWSSRSSIFSPADGVVLLQNNALSDFGRLQFGGTTASFPALKRSSTELQVRLADDSDYAPFRCNGGRFRNIDVGYLGSSTLAILSDSTGVLTFGVSSDVILRRGGAAATLQLGTDAASATAQKIKALNGSGTDIAGSSLTIAGGQSTGTGRGGAVILQTSPSGSTGSSANSYSERAHYSAKAVTLTSATATTIASIAVAAGKFVGGHFIVTVFATDGTDHQARTLRFNLSAVNKAGTVTAAIDTPSEAIAVSAGTLTAAITAVANGNAVDIKVDADSSLTETTLAATWAIGALNGNDVATVTES